MIYLYGREYWRIRNLFSSNIKEVTQISKNGEKITKTTPRRLTCVDSTRFMASSLLNLVNSFAEGIHESKCKYGHYDKNCETCGVKYKDWECCLKYAKIKNNLVEYKCSCCNKN